MTSLALLIALAAIASTGHAQITANHRTGPCTTPNNKPGQCVVVQKCPPILNILKAPPVSPEAQRFLREAQCGFQGRTPIVCCVNSRRNYPDVRNPWIEEPPRVTSRPKPNKKPPPKITGLAQKIQQHPNKRLLPSDICGLDFSSRIFGGDETALDEFPWAALLQYQARDGRKRFLCGGVVINERYILTAAHCTSKGELGNYRLVGVRLGEHNTATETDCEESATGELVCADPPKDFLVETEIAHPQYDKKSQNQFHDIALLRLNGRVQFSTAYIKPICVPTEADVLSKMYIGTNLTVTGWGRTETRASSDVKLKVNVPVVENDACQRIYAQKNRQVSSNQLCAGGNVGQDSCSGDSGGPLMSADKLIDGAVHYHVTGVVSYGPDPCGEKGWPGVYTRVADYSEWILDQLKP